MNFRIAICSLAVLAALSIYAPVSDAAVHRILVLGMDADRDAVPRTSHVHGRIMDRLVSLLKGHGLTAISATEANIDQDALQGSQQISNAVLINAARSAPGATLDTVIAFSLYVRALGPVSAKRMESRLEGRYLAVDSGEDLGSFDVIFPGHRPVGENCGRECLLDQAGAQVEELAGALVRDIIQHIEPKKITEETAPDVRLAQVRVERSASGQFKIVMHGFTSDELALIYKYVPDFEGHARLGEPFAQGMETTLILQNSSNAARLNQNFTLLLRHLDLAADVGTKDHEIRLIRHDKP